MHPTQLSKTVRFLFLLVAVICSATEQAKAQSVPTILIDGVPAMAGNISAAPYWLGQDQTLAPGTGVNAISVLQYAVAVSPSGGNVLQFESVLSVSSLQTVPSGKAWKIEAAAIDPSSLVFGGDHLGNHVATTNLNMSANRIFNLANPTGLTDGVNAITAQNGSLSYASDAGSSGNYVVNLTPAPQAYVAGMQVHFRAASSSLTGGAALNVNGLGAKPIKKQVSVDLIADDILAGQSVSVMYDAVADAFQMLSQTGVQAAGGSSGAGMEIFTSSNPAWVVPLGVTSIVVEAWGGGGGSGGSGGHNVNGGGGSGGGGSGSYGKMMITGLTPGTVVPVVVGAGGTGGTGGTGGGAQPTNGQPGGSSSVNGVVVANGGGAGNGGTNGGNGFNGTPGSGGAAGSAVGGGFSVSGNAGASGSGNTGGAAGAPVNYFPVLNIGAGGAGRNGGTSGSPAGLTGFTGSPGRVIIYY